MSCKWCKQYSKSQNKKRTKLRQLVLANCKCEGE